MNAPRLSRRGLMLVVAFIAATVTMAYWIGRAETADLKRQLSVLTPYALHSGLLLLLGGALTARRIVAGSLKGMGSIWWVVPLVALVVVATLPPRTHRIYYDEDIYQNIAQNMLWHGRAEMCNEGVIEHGVFDCRDSEYNKEPNAFPFMLSLLFRFTGVGESQSHFLNHVVFALGVLASMWIAHLLFDDRRVALGAGVLYLLTPENLLWGATVAAEPGAAAFTGIALVAWILFIRNRSWGTGAMAVGTIVLAVQWRPESLLLLAVVGVTTVLLEPRCFRQVGLYVATLLIFIFLVPHLGHLWAVRGESWGANEGGKFSSQYLSNNLDTNARFYFEGKEHPIYFTLLAILGLGVMGRWKEKGSLLVWFLLFFGVFIPFHAGSYRYGADIRFALLSFMPLAILGGVGARWISGKLSGLLPRSSWLRALPILVAVYFFTSYLPLVRSIGSEAWAARADHDIAKELVEQIPVDSIVLTHNPGMIQVMGQTAAQASVATYNPAKVDDYFRQYAGGVYFHYNFWCNINDSVQNAFCNKILEDYPTQVIDDRNAGFYRYILYRMMPRRQEPAK